jgi:hypothetical protein
MAKVFCILIAALLCFSVGVAPALAKTCPAMQKMDCENHKDKSHKKDCPHCAQGLCAVKLPVSLPKQADSVMLVHPVVIQYFYSPLIAVPFVKGVPTPPPTVKTS